MDQFSSGLYHESFRSSQEKGQVSEVLERKGIE